MLVGALNGLEAVDGKANVEGEKIKKQLLQQKKNEGSVYVM